jgi:hypothetical protein
LGLLGVFSPVGSAGTTAQLQNCRQSTFKKSVKSVVFRTTLLRMSLGVTWCQNGRRVTHAHVTCSIDDMDPVTIQADSCQPQGRPVPWNGRVDGGFYASASVGFSNCVFRYGCWQSAVMNIERWLYADGGVSGSPR